MMNSQEYLREMSESMEVEGVENVACNGSIAPSNSAPTLERQQTVVSFVLSQNELEEKRTKQRKRMAPVLLLVGVYAVVMVLLNVAFATAEVLRDSWLTETVVAVFLSYMFLASCVFLIYLQAGHYMGSKRNKKSKQDQADAARKEVDSTQIIVRKRSSLHSILEEDFEEGIPSAQNNLRRGTIGRNSFSTLPGDVATLCGSLDDDDVFEYIAVNHHQSATLGNHGAGIYLRLGCLMFALGNVIFVITEIEYYQSGKAPPTCKHPLLWPMYFHLLFILVQTFFIFKGFSVHHCKHKALVSVGLMHVFATNLSVWFRFLVKEVHDGIYLSSYDTYDDVTGHDFDGETEVESYATGTNTSAQCVTSDSVLYEAMHYLFPFILEYSLIAVAVIIGMMGALHINISTDTFANVKDMLSKQLRRPSKTDPLPVTTNQPRNTPMAAPAHDVTSLLHKSHGGLFAGIMVFCGVILVLVLFFTTHSEDAYKGSLIYHISNMALTVLLLVGIIMAFVALWPLGRTLDRINLIDDYLIIFSMIGYLLLQFFIIISCMYFLFDTYEYTDTKLGEDDIEIVVRLEVTVAFLESIHCIVQGIFVMDGLQRFAKDSGQGDRKTGRGILSFLVIVNVCMWIFKSFLIKEVVLSRHSSFYGDVAWPVIMSICLPLQLFFFFHSSVCLAEIWSVAYIVRDESVYEGRHLME